MMFVRRTNRAGQYRRRSVPPASAVVVLIWCLLPLTRAAHGAPAKSTQPDPAAAEFFEKKVRPVLAQSCYKCHSTTADKLKAGLYLDSRAGLLKGGENGPAIVPGHPEKSLLIEAVRYQNQDMQMPPKTRLPEPAVADLVKWVQMGAPWPGEASGPGAIAAAALPAGPVVLKNIAGVEYEQLRREHWAWQPVKVLVIPAVQNSSWPWSDIDRFVMAGLEGHALHPVADADKVTLIRRVTFDLTGLPPTPDEVRTFVSDASLIAFEKVVDRLLASPQYGERWGRHWMDVARYAESTGSTRNVPYSSAWRYRDYVIDSFNADKPYNQFVTEQIAGDLLPYKTAAQHNAQQIATGFLALGVKDLNEKDRLKYEMDNVDEQIDTMSRSVLGLTISCARCHDHKFDPIPTAEYYAMAGIFKSTDILSGVNGRKKGGGGKNYDAPDALITLDKTGSLTPVTAAPLSASPRVVPAARPAADSKAATALANQLQQARADLRDLRGEAQQAMAAKKAGKAGGKPKLRAELQEKRSEVEQLEVRIASLEPQVTSSAAVTAPTPATAAISTVAPAAQDGRAIGVRDAARPADARICIRGDADNLGPSVPRGLASVVRLPSEPSIDPAHSGRLQLAEWAASPENPLTARVMVNRIWEHLFGEGLVRTVDNFGTTGEAPSNPQLLDYLATSFVSDGWSVKKTIRKVVLSRAYQLGGTYDPADFTADPGDRLVWRMSPRRLEAESIRDAMLAAAGRLDVARPPGSAVIALPVAEVRKIIPARAADADHRSVYLPILRDLVPPVLDTFDFAEPTMVTGSRDVTTVATQALYLMNDPFVLEQSRRLADRVLAAPAPDDAGRVDLAYRLALARSATAPERARALQYIAAYARDGVPGAKETVKPKAEAWASLCQALFCSAEFRYLN